MMNKEYAKKVVDKIEYIAKCASALENSIGWGNAENAAHNSKILEQAKIDLIELLSR